ncbi:hypothetical protein [Intestinibacter sp.]
MDNGGVAEIGVNGMYNNSSFTTTGNFNVNDKTLEFVSPNTED